MGKKIGIFGGTFDPVHVGHVALVVALKEAHGLDSVFIIPANRSPHKEQSMPQEAKHRLNMLKKAFKDLPYCKVLSLEIDRPGPSYTIDTVDQLKARKIVAAGDRLYLVLGQDLLGRLHTWKNIEELMQHVVPLVARRKDQKWPLLHKELQKWVEPGLTDTPVFDVSSTEIRSRIKKNLYCGHLLHNSVYKYIQRCSLYEYSSSK